MEGVRAKGVQSNHRIPRGEAPEQTYTAPHEIEEAIRDRLRGTCQLQTCLFCASYQTLPPPQDTLDSDQENMRGLTYNRYKET